MATADELLKRYNKLKPEADRLKTERDKAVGALEQLMARLKTYFGCDDLEGAETKLAAFRTEATTAQSEFASALEEYEQALEDAAE